MRLLLPIVLLLATLRSFAQADSVQAPAEMRDGIYLTYQDFRRNLAIGRDDVETPLDKGQLEFMGKLMNEDTLLFRRNGLLLKADPRAIWGFFQNNTLYVNYKEEFYRVPVFGSICYLVANVTVYYPGIYDPMMGYPMGGGRGRELREFLMNFYDGQVREFRMDLVDTLLSRDAAIYRDYQKLGRRQRKEQTYRFIRRYNESHPVFFLGH